MQRKFNLIDEPWVVVINSAPVSLRELFSNLNIRSLSGTPPEKIVITKLLLAICQAACTPEDENARLALTPEILAQKCLAYLDNWYDHFWLYGDQPFLQFPAVSAAGLKPFATVMPDVATGNTSVLTEYQAGSPLNDGQKARLLIMQMSMAMGGKKTDNSLVLTPGYGGKTNDKGKSSASKPGSALGFLGLLHSFVTGDSLLKTLYLNLLTHEEISKAIYNEGLGRAPWEQMPAGEDCPIARSLKNSLMGRLVPLCRFILLTDAGMHLTEGIQHMSYTDGIYDPSVTIKHTGNKINAIWVNPDQRPWRELPALLGFLAAEQQGEGGCLQLKYALEHAKDFDEDFGIWSGGVRVSSNAGEQYVSGKDDVVESCLTLRQTMLSDNEWFELFTNEMNWLDKRAKGLKKCVYNYHKEFTKSEPANMATIAERQFWQQCELQSQNLLFACEQTCINNDRSQLDNLRSVFYALMIQAYDNHCPNQSVRQLSEWAKCHPAIKNQSVEQDNA